VQSTKLFINYLITLPGHEDASLTLDRKDNNKGYEPGNLRFATRSTQACNRRGRAKGVRPFHMRLPIPMKPGQSAVDAFLDNPLLD
jgi:hypothetical protein